MVEMNRASLWDDPARDYRQRYSLPDQFIWDIAAWPRIDFDGYMAIAMSLLPSPPARVLDVGCGPGLGAKLMCERGYEVVGLDYNRRGVDFAKIWVPEAQFLHGDVRLLSEMVSLHDQFDLALHIEVFEHIPPDFHTQVLQGIRCALRASGVLVLSVPSTRMPLNQWDYKHFDRDEIVCLIEENGFQVKHCAYQHRLSMLFSPLVWRLVDNRYYDLRFARQLLRRLFLRWFNDVDDLRKAGRIIIQAVKAQ